MNLLKTIRTCNKAKHIIIRSKIRKTKYFKMGGEIKISYKDKNIASNFRR